MEPTYNLLYFTFRCQKGRGIHCPPLGGAVNSSTDAAFDRNKIIPISEEYDVQNGHREVARVVQHSPNLRSLFVSTAWIKIGGCKDAHLLGGILLQ